MRSHPGADRVIQLKKPPKRLALSGIYLEPGERVAAVGRWFAVFIPLLALELALLILFVVVAVRGPRGLVFVLAPIGIVVTLIAMCAGLIWASRCWAVTNRRLI